MSVPEQEPSTESDYLPEYQTHHSVPNTSQETTTRPITPQPPVLPETTKRAKATNEHSDD